MRSSIAGAALGLVGMSLVAACSSESDTDESERNEQGEIEQGGEVGVFALREGDCFDQPASGDISSVQAVPCDEPHENEIFALYDLDGERFPGETEVQQQGTEGCQGTRFEEFVGLSYQQASSELGLGAGAITPSRESWEEADDREVICIAYNLDDSPLEGSVEGANE
jgi:hypothetical protein